jgi:hypothetical protein
MMKCKGGGGYVPPPPIAGLIGQWHFNDNLNDATIYSHNLTGTATPDYTTGELNDAVDLTDASCDYLILPDSMKFNYASPFTLECWVNAMDFAFGQEIMNIGSDWLCVRIAYDSLSGFPTFYAFLRDSDSVWKQITSASAVLDGTWHHTAVTYDGVGNIALYFDGVSVATGSASFTGNFYDINSQLVIGARLTGGSHTIPLTGCVDEARVWNICRSGEEILANMNTETPNIPIYH